MRLTLRQESTPVPAVEYEASRPHIQNGDVLLYRGRSWASRLVRWSTRARYSHAGLAVWWNDRLMVMEAVGKGVVVSPLSKNVRTYHGSVEWFTSVEAISPDDRLRMCAFAQQELGKEYALWRALVLGFRMLLQRDVEARDRRRREGRLFCSHYVAATYNAVGRDLKKGVSDRFMSPGDIASSTLLRRVGVLRKRGV